MIYKMCNDEKILKLRKIYQKTYDGYDIKKDCIFIQNNWVRFIPITIFDENVKLLMPDTFCEMPEYIAKVRYISENRPSAIWTSSNYSENLCYNILNQKNMDLDTTIKQIEDAILLCFQETVVYDKGLFTSYGLEGRWFEYKSFTVNDEAYNIQFILGSNQKVLIGSFNCRMKFYDEWKIPILKSLEYIQLC